MNKIYKIIGQTVFWVFVSIVVFVLISYVFGGESDWELNDSRTAMCRLIGDWFSFGLHEECLEIKSLTPTP